MEDWHLKEVGMPIDRREGCHMYPHCNSLPPPRFVIRPRMMIIYVKIDG